MINRISPTEASNAKIARMEYENRRATTVPRLLDEGWLSNPDDSGLSLSLSFSRLLLFLLLSPMIIHVRGARHDRQSILRNDTLPLPLFRSVDDDSTCQRVVSLFPAMETGRGRKKRSRTFCSYDFKFDGGFGFGVKMASDCLWKTRGWEFGGFETWRV